MPGRAIYSGFFQGPFLRVKNLPDSIWRGRTGPIRPRGRALSHWRCVSAFPPTWRRLTWRKRTRATSWALRGQGAVTSCWLIYCIYDIVIYHTVYDTQYGPYGLQIRCSIGLELGPPRHYHEEDHHLHRPLERIPPHRLILVVLVLPEHAHGVEVHALQHHVGQLGHPEELRLPTLLAALLQHPVPRLRAPEDDEGAAHGGETPKARARGLQALQTVVYRCHLLHSCISTSLHQVG